MITPTTLSEYFIKSFNEIGDHISHLKLQKLLYYTDAWFRVYFNCELFNEIPQAWVHGPVYASVYHRFKDTGADNLMVERCIDEIKDELSEIFKDDEKTKFINDVFRQYASQSAFALELLTHNEIPWQKAREGYGEIESCTKEIDMEEARRYYKSLLKNA